MHHFRAVTRLASTTLTGELQIDITLTSDIKAVTGRAYPSSPIVTQSQALAADRTAPGGSLRAQLVRSHDVHDLNNARSFSARKAGLTYIVARPGSLLGGIWRAERGAPHVEEGLFDRVGGERAGGVIGRRGFLVSVEAAEQVGSRCVEQVVGIQAS